MGEDEARDEAIEIRKSLSRWSYGNREFFEKWCPMLSKDKAQAGFLCTASQVSLKNLTGVVCRHLATTLGDIRSDKGTKQFVLARTVLASHNQKFGAGSMTVLGRYISRDPMSLNKLSWKGEADIQVRGVTDELLAALSVQDNQ